MTQSYLPTTCEIRDLFAEEISALGGTLRDTFDDGSRLFARAVLARSEEVGPRDSLSAGVALRTTDDEILIHPYTFRQVCKNGAIIAHAIQTRRVARVDFSAPTDAVVEVHSEVREAVRACADEDAFSQAAEEMRSASEVEMDRVLEIMPLLSSLPKRLAAGLLREIVRQYEAGGNRTLFGLMNAVTAVARETRDPDTRWRLEELGGGIPAFLKPRPQPTPSFAELASV